MNVNTKKGLNSAHHPSDVLLGQYAQKNKMFTTYMLNDKATGVYTTQEFNDEWKNVVLPSKQAYHARMIAFGKQVLEQRSKLMKTNALL